MIIFVQNGVIMTKRALFVVCMLLVLACKKEKTVNYEGDGGVTPVPDAVDLGIYIDKPDGSEYCVRWASFNLGASSEEESGEFLSWGELHSKLDYSWDTYIWAKGQHIVTKYCTSESSWTGKKKKPDNKTRLDRSDDAATVRLGHQWRMPTKQEMEALIATRSDKVNYTWEFQTVSGVDGWRITRLETGANIFIPQCGSYEGKEKNKTYPDAGYYWTSDLGQSDIMATFAFLNLGSGVYCIEHERSEGMSVRPVWVD